jgi:hypothetical protein
VDDFRLRELPRAEGRPTSGWHLHLSGFADARRWQNPTSPLFLRPSLPLATLTSVRSSGALSEVYAESVGLVPPLAPRLPFEGIATAAILSRL